MSDVVNAAAAAISEKLGGDGIGGSIKIDITGEGAVRVDDTGVSVDDGDADCVLHADAETLQGILAGDIDPTSALMQGKLSIDGDMGIAMALGNALA